MSMLPPSRAMTGTIEAAMMGRVLPEVSRASLRSIGGKAVKDPKSVLLCMAGAARP